MRSALPGYEIVEEGLRDLREGRETVNSLLVSMAVERLEQLGYSVLNPLSGPEIRLYRELEEQLKTEIPNSSIECVSYTVLIAVGILLRHDGCI